MKVEPKELLNVVAEAATDLVNEHSEFSEQILLVMKMMTKKISDKLFKLEVSGMGLSEEEIEEFLKSNNKESE